MKESPKRTRERGRTQYGCDGTHRGIGTADCPTTPHHHHDEFCNAPRPKTRKMTRIEKSALKVAREYLLHYADRYSETEEIDIAAALVRFALPERSKARRELVKEITDHTKSCEWSARQGGNTIRAERWAATTRMILALSNPGRGKRP